MNFGKPACSSERRDWLAHPTGMIFGWVVPIVAVAVAFAVPIQGVEESFVTVPALLWMGIACAANARRCGRLHCYVTAPLLFMAAIVIAVAETGLVRMRSDLVDTFLLTVGVLILLSCLAELKWGRYSQHGKAAGADTGSERGGSIRQ